MMNESARKDSSGSEGTEEQEQAYTGFLYDEEKKSGRVDAPDKSDDDKKPAAKETVEQSGTPDATEKNKVLIREDGEVESWQQSQSMWRSIAPGNDLVSIDEAFTIRLEMKRGEKDLEDDIPSRLLCDKCTSMNNGVMAGLLVGNEKYVNKYRNTEAWFTHGFVNGFNALVQHNAHMTEPPYRNDHRVLLVYKDYKETFAMTSADIQTYGDATHMVSVAFGDSHFAVLYYDIHNRHVTVFDGLRYPISTWEKQIVATIKGYGLQLPNAVCNSEITNGWVVDGSKAKQKEKAIRLVFDNIRETSWMIRLDRSYMQSDTVSCGPIALLKVMELFGMRSDGEIERLGIGDDPKAYRAAVMDYYSEMVIRYYDTIVVEIRKQTKERMAKRTERKSRMTSTTEETSDAERMAKMPEKKSVMISNIEALSDTRETRRAAAMTKKNLGQAEGAEKAKKRAGKAALEAGAEPGAVVTLHVDYRTHSHAQGLIAIVYDVNKNTGGILVCCEHGVITHSGKKANYWVPTDKYVVVAKKDEYIPLTAALERVRNLVLRGEFEDKTCPRISYAKLHESCIGATSPIKRTKGCQCKGGMCTKACGCKKKRVTCHSGCSCLGNCSG